MQLLFMSIGLAIALSGIVWAIFKIAMWMQHREEKQMKGE